MLDLTTNLLVEIGGWAAMKEARALMERGKVSGVTRDGAVIRARVQGTEKTHDPQITLADRVAQVEVRCTCAEFRRAGRVCPHILAAGLGAMQGPKASASAPFNPNEGPQESPPVVRSSPSPSPGGRRLSRTLIEEAPPGTPRVELTILLPLNVADALASESFRVILEARRDDEQAARPFDAVIAVLKSGFAVSDADEMVLAAMEATTGSAVGVNPIPRAKLDTVLRALSEHPRVWLGKKQRIEVRAAAQRPQLMLSRKADGALVITAEGTHWTSGTDGRNGWRMEGDVLRENVALPPGFSSGARTIPLSQIPDFLTREFPVLERSFDLVFPPGVAEFQLEIGSPTIEAKLEGALSGLTLDLVAHYGAEKFPLTVTTESSAYQKYFPAALPVSPIPNPVNPVEFQSVFWRRNILAERSALAEIEAAGFRVMRAGATTFSLTQESNVARFLANVLPRWRRDWTVTIGSRLTEAMTHLDIAEPTFALNRGSGEDWLGLDLKLSVRGEPVPLDPAEIQRWLQTGQSYARTANKRVLLIPTEAWSEMREVLAECEVEQEPGSMRIGRTFAPYLAGALTAQGFHDASGGGATRAATADAKTALDPALWAQLRPYQAHGVEWLAGLAQQNFHGLLADDMGLGKTLQALAFAAWLKAVRDLRHPERSKAESKNQFGTSNEKTPELILRRALDDRSDTSPTLVVCPTSLVTNWQREAARFTPHLRTLDLTGADRAQKFALRGNYDLLVTSYAILRRDIEVYRAAVFSLVILDEAQHIKNRGSQNAQAAKALRARHRLILTGTPLENSVLDLWSLYDFLLPGYLGTAADFRERYETPLTKVPEPRVMERLRHRVRPFFLRRTKEEVLTELPPKLDFPTLCELSDEQREVYRAVLAQGRREVFEHSGKGGLGRDRIAVLTTLLRLRQVCCHLDLLPTESATLAAASRWKEPSAKMQRTFELIDEAIDGGHRVLLFSQFVRVLHLLREEAKRREISYCYLDGQTVERQAEVDRFQRNETIPLFLISLKAGGTGLNLTGADTVIHFDPWWNPAVEEQATSRAHRMGQSRRVQAYKLIAAGTVEEKIQALQARKRELFEASLASDEAFVEKLTGAELEELLAE